MADGLPEGFAARLRLLIELAGEPKLDAIVLAARRLTAPEARDSHGKRVRPPSRSSVNGWYTGSSRPAEWEQLKPVLQFLIERAVANNLGAAPTPMYLLGSWESFWKRSAVLAQAPYPGLEPISGTDLFFGRDEEVSELLKLVHGGGLLVLTGASGTGKSSLVAAGLVRSWREERQEPVLFAPGESPLAALKAAVPALTDLIDDPTRKPLDDPVWATLAAQNSPPEPQLWVVDQFEEAFALATEPERLRFIAVLDAATRPGTDRPAAAVVVLVARSEILPDLIDHPRLREAVAQRQMVLSPMSEAQVREAIERPAAEVGLRLGDRLLETVLMEADLLDPTGQTTGRDVGGLLPLIMHTLRIAYDQRSARQRDLLTLKDYRATGGIRKAIQETADDVWRKLETAGLAPAALDVLINLVAIASDPRRDTRQRKRPAVLVQQSLAPRTAEKALTVLIEARLVSEDKGEVQITHESLMREWPRLRETINKDRTRLVYKQELEEAAKRWIDAGKDESLLWAGAMLRGAHQRLDGDPGVGQHQALLSEVAREFLAAADARARRHVTRRRTLQLIAGAGVAAIAGTAAFGWSAARRSTRYQLITEAENLADVDASAAAALDVVAYKHGATDELATRILSAAAATPLSIPSHVHTAAVNAVVIAADGATVFTASDDHTVAAWRLGDGGALLPKGDPVLHHTAPAVSLAISPDQRTLLSGAFDATAVLWDITSGHQPRPYPVPLRGHIGNINSVVWISPTIAATGGRDATIRIWDCAHLAAPRLLATLTQHRDVVNGLAVNTNSTLMASSSDDGTVIVWHIADPQRVTPAAAPIATGQGWVQRVAFSPRAPILASCDYDVKLWDLTHPERPTPIGAPLQGHDGRIYTLSFSPDGLQLATGSADQTVRRYLVANPAAAQQLGPVLAGHEDIVYTTGWHPDGTRLFSGAQDKDVRTWRLPPALLGHQGAITSVALTADGAMAVTGSEDQTAIVWRLGPGEGRIVARLQGHRGPISSVALTGDGAMAVTGSEDQTAIVWRLGPGGGQIVARLTGHGDAVTAVAISPDHSSITTGCANHVATVWTPAGAVTTRLRGHGRTVTSISYSPDGDTIATGSSDESVMLWHARGPHLGHPRSEPLRGHHAAVTSVVITNEYVISGSADRTVRLWHWDAARGEVKPIGRDGLTGHTAAVNAVAVAPHSQLLVTGSADHSAIAWPLQIDNAIARVVRDGGDSLTPKLWEKYLPNLSYERATI